MINATSQKRALKATPKLVCFLELHLLHQLCVGMHHRPSICIHSNYAGYPLCGGAPTKTSPLERKHQLKNRDHAKTGQRILVEELWYRASDK